MSRAIFTSSNGSYIPFLNAFLNSLQKQHLYGPPITVYLVHWDMPLDYLDACTRSFSFEVIPIPVNPKDFTDTEFSNMEICKASRYYYMKEISLQTNLRVACLMDCDLMVVNPDFFNLFDMVDGTTHAIGCNERFKWTVGPAFKYPNGDPLFETRRKLFKFHCNTPLFLGDPTEQTWQDTLEKYLEIVYQATEDHPKKGKVKVGDIFAWNYAVNICEAEDRFILFPMEVMTQVHQTAYKPWTRLMKEGDYYYTYAGDPVLSLHGRCGRPGFGRFQKSIGVEEQAIKNINELFYQEWYDLNFRQMLKLTDYVKMQDHWQDWLDANGWVV